ncbi:MAG: hypothetical protein U0836_05605 [Pirellulales bacterium]
MTVGFQLLAIFAALANVSLPQRLMVCSGIAIAATALFAGMAEPSVPQFFLRQLGQMASLFLFMVGLLLPVRLYLGTIGLERGGAAPQPPSLRGLFGLTAYGGFAALVLSLGNPRLQVGLAVWAAILNFTCLSSMVAVLSKSPRLQKLGFWCVALLILAAIALGTIEPEVTLLLGSLVVLPLVAAAVLRTNGYRLRR